MKKAKKAPETCSKCSQPLRVPCPVCGQPVHIIDGELAAHDGFECTGSHMEYGSCKGSKKKVSRAKTITARATSAMVWDNNRESGAALVRIEMPVLNLLSLPVEEREKLRKEIAARIVRALQAIEV